MRMLVIAVLLLCGAGAASVLAAGNALAGRQLAYQWCAGCHIVDYSSQGPDRAPPFPVLARRKDRSWLRTWLTMPHPPMPMPNPSFSRQQIDDIVAYLDSLKPG